MSCGQAEVSDSYAHIKMKSLWDLYILNAWLTSARLQHLCQHNKAVLLFTSRHGWLQHLNAAQQLLLASNACS